MTARLFRPGHPWHRRVVALIDQPRPHGRVLVHQGGATLPVLPCELIQRTPATDRALFDHESRHRARHLAISNGATGIAARWCGTGAALVPHPSGTATGGRST